MRQIAMVNLGLLVLVGVAGCGAPGGFSVPKGAQLRAEASPAGKGNFSSFTINERGRLYIYDADNARLLYSGTVEPNNTVRLYPDGAAIVPSSTRRVRSTSRI
jgi:hypothetical protein